MSRARLQHLFVYFKAAARRISIASFIVGHTGVNAATSISSAFSAISLPSGPFSSRRRVLMLDNNTNFYKLTACLPLLLS